MKKKEKIKIYGKILNNESLNNSTISLIMSNGINVSPYSNNPISNKYIYYPTKTPGALDESCRTFNKKWNDYVTDGLYICGEGRDWFHDNS